jgi:Streptomyces sporulation and cell division protein, SsgA
MIKPSAQVRAALVLRLVSPKSELELDATLRYDTDDPYAVRLGFPTAPGREAVEWMFARELLAAGLVAPAGDGDVRIWPSPEQGDDQLYVELCSPSGRALFILRRAVLAEFSRRCEELVPPGTEAEHLDIDAELDALLHDDLS